MTIYVLNTDKNVFVGKFRNAGAADAAMKSTRFNPYFVGSSDDLDSFSVADLAEIYNSTIDADKHIKKFSDKGTAVKRTFERLQIAEPKRTASRQSAGKFAKGGSTRYSDSDTIHLLKDENPRRSAGAGNGQRNWELYEEGMTVGSYLAKRRARDDIKGSLCVHLYWDVEYGHIEVRKVGEV